MTNSIIRNVAAPLDFETDIFSFLDAQPHVHDIRVKYSEEPVIKLLNTAICNGLFFRHTQNPDSFNYWQPLSNAGLPNVRKPDYIHELTFLIHDIMHNLIPDLEISSRDLLDKKVYTIWRMMGEGISMVLADMYFVDLLNREGIKYDYTQRCIYPLFRHLKQNTLRANLQANARFAAYGDLAYFTLDQKDKGKDLYVFSKAYNHFFTADLKWTIDNAVSKLHLAGSYFDWVETFKNRLPKLANNPGISMITTHDVISAMGIPENMSAKVMTNAIFAYLYNTLIKPVAEDRRDPGPYSFSEASLRAQRRFWAYQIKIAYDYNLDVNYYLAMFDADNFQCLAEKYQSDLEYLLSLKLISPKQYELFKEVYPHHRASHVSYTHRRYSQLPYSEYAAMMYRNI